MRLFLLVAAAASAALAAARPFEDRKHFSKVFGEERNYRLLLPPGYESSGKRYPVIYYFHGHSDRYTVEKYDNGADTIPKMAEFVAAHDVIVVCADGYVARDYTGFYGGAPYDVLRGGGDYDFGLYFLELAGHIDATLRTLTSRRYRATSGLSMGGFMSLWLSARYPDRIGSASSFNPGPEFYTGDKGRRVLWRPKDHVSNHARTMVRLIRASGDYISQYHEETRDAYARASAMDFEFRQDEFHRHWATSIGETFAFHMRAFARPSLDNVPEVWSHASAYRDFEAWGLRAHVEGPAATVYLDDVRQGGLRVRTRRWAPDGPAAADVRITLTTPAQYQAGAEYEVTDFPLYARARPTRARLTADAQGRLRITADGAGHQFSFAGPGTGAQPPVLLPITAKDRVAVWPDVDTVLPVRIYNPRAAPMTGVKVEWSTEYPTVRLDTPAAAIPSLAPGAAADVPLRLRATSGDGYLAPARLRLKLTFDGWYSAEEDVDIDIVPAVLPRADAVEVLDGREITLPVFRQKGNQGGGGPVQRTVREGKGNGNGRLEPGEEATIWVRLAQGLDPFDRNTWHRAKVRFDSPYITEVADLQEQKQLEWTSAQERTSVIRLDPAAPRGASIPLLLDFESWSYHWTPDVRYGPQPLYQAFQLHRRHLARYTVEP